MHCTKVGKLEFLFVLSTVILKLLQKRIRVRNDNINNNYNNEFKKNNKKKFLMGEINVNGMSGSTVRVAAKVSSIAPSYD